MGTPQPGNEHLFGMAQIICANTCTRIKSILDSFCCTLAPEAFLTCSIGEANSTVDLGDGSSDDSVEVSANVLGNTP